MKLINKKVIFESYNPVRSEAVISIKTGSGVGYNTVAVLATDEQQARQIAKALEESRVKLSDLNHREW